MTNAFGDMSKMPTLKAESLMEAGTIWAKGLQELSHTVSETSKTQIEEIMETWKSLSSVKSFDEMKEIQMAFAKTFYEKSLANTTRIIGEFTTLAEKSMAPIKTLP